MRPHLASVIAPYDVLWVRGGNTFTLRHAMRESGFDDLVVAGLRADGFVYAGYSAGPCVPHLQSPGHPETELLDAVSARYTADGIAHHRLRDGQVLVVDGDRQQL